MVLKRNEDFMEEYIVEGNISVKAVLMANRRDVYRIVVDKNKKDKDSAYILHRAKDKHVLVEFKEREEIDALALGKTHGGMLAYCGERTYQDIQDVMQQDKTFIALIEGVEDPFNFGYVLRTLYAAGCDGVIVSPRNWTTAADVVTRASAGASEYINIFIAEDMNDTLEHIKRANIRFVCAQRSDAISLYEYEFPNRICIAIGGEMRGLSKPVLAQSEQNLYIPYRADFKNAMTAAASTAIFAFEIVRQNK